MRSAVRRTMIILLLATFLAPGLLQARPPVLSWDHVSLPGPEALFTKVWNLLASLWHNGGSGASSKNGCGLDPAGQPLCGSGPSAPPTGENGSGLDPAGKP